MVKEDLSKAIGNISDQYITEALEYTPKIVMFNPDEDITMRKKYSYSFFKTAACFVLVLSLVLGTGAGVYAFVTRILLKTNDDGTYAETSFETGDDQYIELDSWIPQIIPDGYVLDFVSDPASGYQSINYVKDADTFIRYEYGRPGSMGELMIEDYENKEELKIQGCNALLYSLASGSKTLMWTNDEAGIGYRLFTSASDVDLIAIAESVRITDCPPVPTFAKEVSAALESIGEHILSKLPIGYEEASVTGLPVSEGGNWYGYVQRTYENKRTNDEIVLKYETYLIEGYEEPSADEVLALAGLAGDEVEIGTCKGVKSSSDKMTVVVWVDTEEQLKYTVSSSQLSGDELLAVARSIR